MKSLLSTLTALSALAIVSSASSVHASQIGRRSFVKRDGVNYTVYDHPPTRSAMSYVKNSGICETTPGVNQVGSL